jgi:hypothetical protein
MRVHAFMTLLLPALLGGLLACNQGDFAGGAGAKKSADADDGDDEDQDDDDDGGSGDDDGDDGLGSDEEGTDDEEIDGTDSDAELGTEAKDDILAAVDSACALGVQGKPPVAPPSDNLPKTAPAGCRSGIEFNRFERHSFRLKAKQTTDKQTPLEIDLASYTAEDHMKLIAETEDGERVVMDTCRLRTATYADPTNGSTRPPEDSIREFRLKLPKKTTALRFDWTGASSPTYIRVIGLCDFESTASDLTGGNLNIRPASD